MAVKKSISYLWMGLGFFSLALGIIGIALPLLPTTPFLLLSAFAFARSSEKFHQKLLAHPHFGPPIKDWQDRGAISVKAKVMTMIMIAVSPILAWVFSVPGWIIILQITALAFVSLFILTRPSS